MKNISLKHDRIFWSTIAICTGLLVLILFEPLSFDNALYQQMARELWIYHRIPYLQTWDQNFPGIIYLHLLEILLFGSRDISVRILDIIIQIGFCAVLFDLSRRWFTERTAIITVILYAAYYVSQGQSVYFERDPYAAMCCITAFYLLSRTYLRELFQWLCFVIAAILTGYSILLKPTAVLYAFVVIVILFLQERNRSATTHSILKILLFVVLAALPLGMVILYYSGIPNGLQSFYLATVRYNLDLYAGGRSTISEILRVLLRTAFLFPAAAFGWWLIRSKRASNYFNPTLPNVSVWIYYLAVAVTFLTVYSQGKFWQYHWMPFCIVIIPLATIAIEWVVDRFHRPLARHYALIGCIVLCSFIQMNPKSQASILYDITHRQPLFGDTYDFASTEPDLGAKAERETIQYLDSMGVKDRDVEICSLEPHLKLHYPCETLGAYGILTQLGQRPTGSKVLLPFTSYQRQWQQAYFDTLRASPPRFIVILQSKVFSGVDTILHSIPGFDTFFANNYTHDTAFGSYQIYRRK